MQRKRRLVTQYPCQSVTAKLRVECPLLFPLLNDSLEHGSVEWIQRLKKQLDRTDPFGDIINRSILLNVPYSTMVDFLGYTQLRLVSRGTYGNIYVCGKTSEEKKRNTTLKVSSFAVPSHDDFIWNWVVAITEADFMSRFNHPGILPFFRGFFSSADNILLESFVLETSRQCTDFSVYLRSQSVLDYTVVLQLIYDLLQGLYYLHNQHVVHMDIKPANLLVSSDTRGVLCDFGMAVESVPFLRKHHVVRTTAMFRHPCLAAACIGNQKLILSPEHDLWSVGIMVLNMLLSTSFIPESVMDESLEEHRSQKLLLYLVNVFGPVSLDWWHSYAGTKYDTFWHRLNAHATKHRRSLWDILTMDSRFVFSRKVSHWPNTRKKQLVNFVSKLLTWNVESHVSTLECVQDGLFVSLLHYPWVENPLNTLSVTEQQWRDAHVSQRYAGRILDRFKVRFNSYIRCIYGSPLNPDLWVAWADMLCLSLEIFLRLVFANTPVYNVFDVVLFVAQSVLQNSIATEDFLKHVPVFDHSPKRFMEECVKVLYLLEFRVRVRSIPIWDIQAKLMNWNETRAAILKHFPSHTSSIWVDNFILKCPYFHKSIK